MKTDEEYRNFLKQLIACVDHGDYYAIKELLRLELSKIDSKNEKSK